ncbi:hypothetical protein AVEN_120201-1 [Araneus ventricosus]|uniref:Uncharacterized protein n=1 Tax=Araneus ventricosus TaxID=182803 RepID=A0A4Y2ULT8_ARAVE|nr:hypothetical protein AVEN_120201-1 [Araneus ventricosus]
MGKIFGGGVKIITDNDKKREAIKAHLEKDPDAMNNFVISLAVRRRPQMILYNIDGEIEAEELQIGLLEKSLFLRDEKNDPLFRVDFRYRLKIERPDSGWSHWNPPYLENLTT